MVHAEQTTRETGLLSLPMEPIAIVGLALKFPGDADSEDGLWHVLTESKCTMTEWPEDRLNIDAYHSLSRREKSSIAGRGAHFLKDDPILFDAPFFSITATEAASLDPQQRGMLETTYKALENAGIPMAAVRGSSTGVYTGSMCDDYKLVLSQDLERSPKYSANGTSLSMLANRISWFFDLTGPSINLDSACSSSLMALDFACQGLRGGDTCMALVAGANLLLTLDNSVSMSRMGFTSPDSKCFSFDDRANGYARSEGFGVVVLKRLSDAVRDNDTIRAVIRSTGSNQDGHTPGITQPSKENQAKLIRSTYEKAGLDPTATRYFEAHGTGTPIGDPIEATAIGSVFHSYRSSSNPLYVGALKSNLGHLEGASGIASIIKATLVLEKGIIPPNTNFDRVNPRIRADLLNLKFPTKSIPWPSEGLRRASVNSFGFGGSNAHAVLDDAYSVLEGLGLQAHHSTVTDSTRLRMNGSSGTIGANGINGTNGTNGANGANGAKGVNGVNGHTSKPKPKLLIWSAADKDALSRVVSDYTNYHLGNLAELSKDVGYLHHLAYTLSLRRTHHAWRTFAIAPSVECLPTLSQFVAPPVRVAKESGIIFAFTGQGAQYASMGMELLQWPVFRDAITTFDNILGGLGCEWSVFEGINDAANLEEPIYSQPLCTALQIALIELLRSFGIVPAAVVGHSSGEIAASYAIGAISLTSAVRISYHRGQVASRLLNSTSGSRGSMLAVGLSEVAVQPYLSSYERLSVACINSPLNITIAGNKDQIVSLQVDLDAAGVFCRELKTGVAYHSTQMQDAAAEYFAAIQDLETGSSTSPSVTMASSVTGDFVTASSLRDPNYWVQNMVSPVRFSDALTKLASRPKTRRKLGQKSHLDFQDIIEVGPHSALQRPIDEVLKAAKRQMRYTSALSRFQPASHQVLTLAGRLFCSGYSVSLEQVNNIDLTQPRKNRHLVHLPLYSFSQTHRHWEESKLSQSLRLRQHFPRTLLGAPVRDWNPLEAKWRRYLSHKDQPWLLDHKIDGSALLPATGMIALALEAAHQMANSELVITGYWIKEANFYNAVVIPTDEEDSAEMETFLRPSATGSALSEVRICVRSGDRWTDACRVSVQVEYHSSRPESSDANESALRIRSTSERHDQIASQCVKRVDRDILYRTYDKMGLQYGPTFRNLHNTTWNEDNAATADVRLLPRKASSVESEADTFLIHPGTLDAIVHLGFVPLTHGGTQIFRTAMPTRIRNAWVANVDTRDAGEDTFWRATATALCNGFKKIEGNFTVLDQNGEVVISIGKMESNTVVRDDEERVVPNRLCFGLDLKPDVDILEPAQMARLDLQCFMGLMVHKYPTLRVLEINIGVGNVTTAVLASISKSRSKDAQLFSRYVCTDKDPDMLARAREKVNEVDYSNQLSFLPLDLSYNPVHQGLEAGSFDVVLYSEEPDAATNREEHLAHARQLLATGGHLVQIKEDLGILVSKAPGETPPCSTDKILILVQGDSEFQRNLAALVQLKLTGNGCPSCEVVPLDTLNCRQDIDEHSFICLVETEKPFLSQLSPSSYASLQFVLSHGKGMLWITKAVLDSPSWPEMQMVAGLARVLRSENPVRSFITLSLEDATTDTKSMAQAIVNIAAKCDSSVFSPDHSEVEYVLRGGLVQTRRVTEFNELDQYIHDQTKAQLKHRTINEGGPLTLSVGSPGVLDSLRFVRDNTYIQPLGPNEIELEVRAVGLNFKDLLTALGKVDDDRFGVECSGVVYRVGAQCTGIFQPGDRVFALNNGCMKTNVRCHVDTVFKMPDDMSFEYAAAFPIVGVTAYYGLVEMARLQKGETVLVHAGAGGTGQFCIQIAQAVGAEVFATVSSPSKRDLLKAQYGLTDDHIFYSRNTSFAEATKRATNGRGVDVLVNSLGGDSLVASWEVMAPFGRFVELGKADINANAGLPMLSFAKNVSFIAVNIDYAIDHKPQLIKRVTEQLVAMMAEKHLTVPHPLQTYNFPQVEDAFRHMQSGKSTGKIVLTCQPDDVVQTYMPTPSSWTFPIDATYLIAGGLGGLGRSAARWMAGKGAKHLILLSRSGAASEPAQCLVQELQDMDVRVEALKCDVSNADDLRAVLAHCEKTMPPIQGCVQGTMVLRDALFENMTYDDWTTSLASKHLASWNLHRQLPSTLSFFILLSSLSGIAGTVGQANYAAGNTYQDALAHQRNLLGQPAVSLDLGVMDGVGVIAEKDEYAAHRGGLGGMLRVVHEQDFHAILDYYCHINPNPDSTQHLSYSRQGQALFGLPTQRHLLENAPQGNRELPSLLTQPIFSLLAHLDVNTSTSSHSDSSATDADTPNYAHLFAHAANPIAAAAVVTSSLAAKVSRAIAISAADIDTSKPLHAYGVDSLVAVELRNWLAREFSANVAVFSLMGAASLEAVGKLVVEGVDWANRWGKARGYKGGDVE